MLNLFSLTLVRLFFKIIIIMTNKKSLWYIEGIIDNIKSIVIPIDKDSFIIGRIEDCDLSLPSNNVSRKHVEIYYNGTSLFLKDLKSTNGTYVNDKKVKEDVFLKNGDTIRIANFEFKIYLKDVQKGDHKTKTFFVNDSKKQDSFTEYYDLTKREEEILYLIIQGKSTKKISDILFISIGTAKNHVLNIFKKVNVHSKFELLTLYNNFNASQKTPSKD